MRNTSSKYQSPKASQNQAHKRKLQLLELSAKLLPQLLQKTLEPRLTALEKASSTLIQDIFTIRSDVREVTEKAAPFMNEYNNQPASIHQLSQYASPDTSVINEKIKSIPFIPTSINSNEFKNQDIRKGGRLSPLSPIGSPSKDALQDLATLMFTYESPKSSAFQDFHTSPKQSRKNPYDFLIKAIESVKQISRRELAELRSLISPPPGVTSVMEALCILFYKKPKWPVARDLIDSGDIITRIVRYDLNNLEQQTIEKVDLYVKSPLIEYDKLKLQCPVAAVIWKWIRAVHYCFISVAKAQKEGIKIEQLTTEYITYMTKEEEELEEKAQERQPEKEYKLEPKPVKMSEKKQSDSSTMSEDQDKKLVEVTKRVKTIPRKDLLSLLLMTKVPTEIKVLFETVCLVLGKEPTWENARILIKKGCLLDNVESVKPELLSRIAQEMIKEILAVPMPLQKELPFVEDLRNWLGTLESLVVEKDKEDKEQAPIFEEDEPKIEKQQQQKEFKIEKKPVPKMNLSGNTSPTVSRKGSESSTSKKPSPVLRKQSTNSFNSKMDKLDLNETIPHIPMISETLAIFKGLKRSDFAELKKNRDIPAVRAVLEGLYLVFEVPPKVRIDLRTVGDLDFDRLAGDLDQLLTKIFQFNYDEIPENLIIKLKEHTRQPRCSIASAKSVSSGVWALCLWLHVLIRFSETKESLNYHPVGTQQTPNPALKKLEEILPSSVRGKSNSFSLSPSKSSRATPLRDYKILGDTELEKEIDGDNRFTLEFDDLQLSERFANTYFSVNDVLEFKEKPQTTKLTEMIMKVFYIILTGRKLQIKEIQKALPADSKGLNRLMNINPSDVSVRAIKLAETEFKEVKNAEKQLSQSSAVLAIFKWIQTVLEVYNQQKDGDRLLIKKKSEGKESILDMVIPEEPSSSVIPEEQVVPENTTKRRQNNNNKSTLRMRSVDSNSNNWDVEEIQNNSYLQRNLNESKREVADYQLDEGSSFITNNLRSIIKEMKREETEVNNMHWDGLLANKEHRNYLKGILIEDNEVDASNREMETYFAQKLDRYSTKINHLKTVNKLLTDNGVPTNPDQKSYNMKAGTASFIRMIEPEWIRNLMNQPYWDELISKILTVFVTIYGNKEAINMPNNTELREQITEELKKIQGNTISALLEIGEHMELDTKLKIKMQKLLKQHKDILNPRSFDGIDGFCGVLSFLFKEVCEYLGLLPIDMVKKLNSKERLYLFNLQKIEYYGNQIQKISEVAGQRQLAL